MLRTRSDLPSSVAVVIQTWPSSTATVSLLNHCRSSGPSVRSVPAAEVEEAVVSQVRHLLRTPEIIARGYDARFLRMWHYYLAYCEAGFAIRVDHNVANASVKAPELTIDEMEHRIDEKMAPVAALGYNAQWPGPTIRVTEGDKVRAIFKNNLKETTGVHFHGIDFDNFFMDGVPFVTQLPIPPGETFTYEFVANPAGSMMYHSHHNATDQVGRGLLGAFIIDPKEPTVKYDREYIWISNDTLGGFTINGHGFPAVVPVLAAVGETVLIRYMNEGIMMHPWHSHGYTQRVVARDGRPLGTAEFDCDTLGVNPGERFDVTITAERPGIWAFHCHILPHVEGLNGMFGMVTTLIVVPEKSDIDAIYKALGVG